MLGAFGASPTCAGPTTPHRTNRLKSREHPRVRGADTSTMAINTVSYGASPRARDRQQAPHRDGRAVRTIPACAGPTPAQPVKTAPVQDHPRVRGADGTWWSGCPVWPGPSPRARGRRALAWAGVAAQGTIPACAGPTLVDL